MIRLLLLFYFIGLLVFLIGSGISIYQLLRYRMPKDKSLISVYGYLLISGTILIVSLISIFRLDWS